MIVTKLPKEIQELVKERVNDQPEFRTHEHLVKLENMFDWGLSKEGFDFWADISQGEYNQYYEIYGTGCSVSRLDMLYSMGCL